MTSACPQELQRCGVYSFPKSGNTWMREIIRALFQVDKDIMEVVPDIYRHGVNGLRLTAPNGETWSYYKSHAAHELQYHGGAPVANAFILYMLRNPMDVFCSQLNFLLRKYDPTRGGIQIPCESLEEACQTGLLDDFFSSFVVYGTLMPFFVETRSWMENARLWLEKARESDKICVIRYEDMLKDAQVALKPMLDRFGFSDEDLTRALHTAEQRTNDGGQFFWKKKAGTYKQYLNAGHVEKFLRHHGDVVIMAGYKNYYADLCRHP